MYQQTFHFMSKLPTTYASARTYIAAVYANTIQLTARVKTINNMVHLQALTTRDLAHNLRDKMTLREYFIGSAWHTLLKIDQKQLVIDANRMSEYANKSYISPEHILFAEKLYGVPQPLWEMFTDHLDHQEVVALLNLKRHRHLWPAYQYVLSAPTETLITARAKLIGQYHFLLSIAINDIQNIKQHHEKIKYQFHFSALEDIKYDLDHGRFDNTKMATIHPCFTVVFLNKLRHCSNIFDLSMLAKVVSNYANPTLEARVHQRQFTAINWLLSSETDANRFASSLNLAKVVHKMSARPGLLFFNSQSQWQNYANHQDDVSNIGKLYFDALFNDLIRREMILQANATNVLIDDDLIHCVKERFESFFINDVSISNIELLQTYWQNNMPWIEAIKPTKKQSLCWSPIIADMIMDGIKIHPITSEAELIQHGKKMRHCVQENVFIKLCRNKGAEIIELTSRDETSTLDLRITNPYDVTLQQHRSVGGVNLPSIQHLQVGIKLVTYMQTGRIKLSKARRTEYLKEGSKPLCEFDYDLNDLCTQEQVYQMYKSKKMLPKRLIFANYQDMLDGTKLTNMINNTFQKKLKLKI